MMKVISRKLVRKALEMIRKLADADEEEDSDEDESDDNVDKEESSSEDEDEKERRSEESKQILNSARNKTDRRGPGPDG